MSSKEQANHDDTVASIQRSSKPSVRDTAAITGHIHPATIIRRAGFESGSLTPRDVLQLQRTMGNQAVQRLLQAKDDGLVAPSDTEEGVRFDHDFSRIAGPPDASAGVQAKLAVDAPGDDYEQEADRISEQVVRMPEPQGVCACGGGCPRCGNEQGGHEQLQTKRVQANDAGESSTPSIARELVSSPGQPLDPTTRGFMESRFGQDFSQVRVHTGPRADDAARAVEARAFTLGHDIVFGQGQYVPHETTGQRLLAHELTHVIQQRPGGDAAAAHDSGAPAVRQHAPAFGVQRQKADPAATKDEDAAFMEWWKLVAGFEGSLEDWKKRPQNKNDRGGETNWGVTKNLYMSRAKALGLPATPEGFAAMTPDQAMRFGRMIWKASGAHKVKNTGVALVLADWYWGGIHLTRFSDLLKEKGRAASFNMGMPDDATIEFLNTLSPSEMVELMSDAKAAQYRAIVKKDPKQGEFLKGWLKRNEERRRQAQPFAPGMSLPDRGQRALEQARGVLQMKDAASSEAKKAARAELWAVVGRIEEQQMAGFDSAEEEGTMRHLKGQLLKEISRLMDAGP